MADIDRFLADLELIPWFANIGKSLPAGAAVKQIHDWDEWPGPEEESVNADGEEQQALFDLLMEQGKTKELQRVGDQIQTKVLHIVHNRSSYDANEDAWDAPSAAAWHAAWTAGLVGLCLVTGKEIPRNLQTQWDWFLRGRWPCDWYGDIDEGNPIVF